MASLERVLRSVLKIGLNAAVPGLGDAIEEGGDLLLDVWVEGRARDLHARLLKQVADHANVLVSADALVLERLEYLLPTIESILSRHGVRLGEWSQTRFSLERATAAVIERAGDSLKGLSDDDVEVIRLLVGAFHAALLAESETLRATESDFRSLVLGSLDRLLEVVAGQAAEQAESTAHLVAAALIGLPQWPWRPRISSPGALLRADIEGGVPFHGRHDETASIENWCAGLAPIGLRLYTGAGGMGKTRLFVEMCQRLQARRWRAGFLEDRAARAPEAAWSKLVHHPDSLFLVVDYAETRRADLVALLREVLKVGDDRRVRIVLLARAAGTPHDWWDELRMEHQGVNDLLAGPATQRLSLRPLALTTEDRAESYRLASRTFVDRLKPEKPSSDDLPKDLDSETFERILLLHMSALAAIHGTRVKGEQGILNYVLQRERSFWRERAKAKGLPLDLMPGIGQAMAVLTLGGGARTQQDAFTLLRKIPLLQRQTPARLHRVSTLIHETYPGVKWIEPILPDLLGEHLVQVEYGQV